VNPLLGLKKLGILGSVLTHYRDSDRTKGMWVLSFLLVIKVLIEYNNVSLQA
jgi:hypothetical protein